MRICGTSSTTDTSKRKMSFHFDPCLYPNLASESLVLVPHGVSPSRTYPCSDTTLVETVGHLSVYTPCESRTRKKEEGGNFVFVHGNKVPSGPRTEVSDVRLEVHHGKVPCL